MARRSRPGDPGLAPPPLVDRLVVLFGYDATVAAVVLAAKNGGRRDLLAHLGRWLAMLDTEPVDVVTWVPASRRRRRRGFDQGRELAVAAARERAIPAANLLLRRGRRAQAGTSRQERLAGPDLAARRPSPARVLLVDDVSTTGASLSTAAGVLRRQGAGQVICAVVAKASDSPT